jgi:hypothetical protein
VRSGCGAVHRLRTLHRRRMRRRLTHFGTRGPSLLCRARLGTGPFCQPWTRLTFRPPRDPRTRLSTRTCLDTGPRFDSGARLCARTRG